VDHSEDIGFLKARAESSANQLTALFDKNEKQITLTIETNQLIKQHIDMSNHKYTDIKDEIDAVKLVVEDCKKGVDEFYSIKKFAVWFGGAVTLTWSLVWKLLDKVQPW